MEHGGELRGEKLVSLLGELIEKKIMISMQLIGSQFERLTYVMDLNLDDAPPCLILDKPEGFDAAVKTSETKQLRFKFNGPDKLPYTFRSQGGTSKGHDLYITLPEYLERIQRRKDFRVDTPVGARMMFSVDKTTCVISMVNISMGGVFGVLTTPKVTRDDKSLLKPDQRLYRLSLFFPKDEELEPTAITIKKAEVRRVERDKEKVLMKYAFEFIDIEPQEGQLLTRVIYHIQRKLLQNR